MIDFQEKTTLTSSFITLYDIRVGFITTTWYRDTDRGFVDPAIPHRLRSDDIVHEHTSHAQGRSFETPGYAVSPRQGAVMPSNIPTHALFDLYFAHAASSLFKLPLPMSRWRQWQGESFLGGQHHNAVPTPAANVESGQRMCADHKV